MTDIKVSLSVTVPGAVMFSKQLCFKNSKHIDKNGNEVNIETPIEGMTDHHHFIHKYFDTKTKKNVTEHYDFHTRKSIPARQVINLCSEAFDYMTSASCPEWFRVPGQRPVIAWGNLSEIQRLELHLNRIAESLNGIVDEYQILGD